MILFYFIASIPLIIGGILWLCSKRIAWAEWLSASVLAFLLAIIFNWLAVSGMTADTETWSGKITSAKHFSAWTEYYEYAVYRTEYYYVSVSDYTTDSKGHSHRSGSHREQRSRQVFDHWQPDQRYHADHWESYSDLGSTFNIDSSRYNYFVNKYDMNNPIHGVRSTSDHNSHMISGDPNDYDTEWNKTQWIEPITEIHNWVNKIKAAPSVFSFAMVPTNIPVFKWPSNPDQFHSERVLGTAKTVINLYQWDRLNAILGPMKKVNLIIVGFDSSDPMMGQYQQSKWIGGKKNDLVITYGGNALKPDWVYVFGWTDSSLAKAEITSYIVDNGVTKNIYTFLQSEIIKNYKIKQWKDFDYIKVPPNPHYYWYFLITLIFVEGGLYTWFLMNDYGKDEDGEAQSRLWNPEAWQRRKLYEPAGFTRKKKRY